MIAIESYRTREGIGATGRIASAGFQTTLWGDETFECNSGSPRGRSRTLALQSTILGDGVDHISCPRVRSVALDFGEVDPVAYVRDRLLGLGYGSPASALRSLLPILQGCVCCVSNEIEPAPVDSLEPEVLLEQALVLGLSTKSHFDPFRPVIWTRASLTRRLNLYEIEGFYA